MATPANDNRPTRLDIVRDGQIDRSAFETVLFSLVQQEINLRLCGAAGLKAPKSMHPGDVPAWRAACVKQFGLGPISDAERTRIAAHERRELSEWAAAMVAGAEKQRAAMDAAAVAPVKDRVPARSLRHGDVVGSGEKVVAVSAGVRTPSGKVEVTLERDGHTRMSVWGAHTLVNITRAPVGEALQAAE